MEEIVEVKEEFIEGVTKSGFKYRINKRLADDYDFVEKYSDTAKTGIGMPDLLKYMIGDKEYESLKAYCRRKDGFLSTKRMQHEMEDIMNTKIDDSVNLKNS